MTDYLKAKQYVVEAIQSFTNDPADTDFQRGYLAALETVLKEAFHTKATRGPSYGSLHH